MDHGFEVFLPLVQTKRASAPLFTGYFFCRIVDRWRAINTTFGVLCLVRTGDCPAKCPDHEIDSLKAMIDGHGYIRLPEAPPPPCARKIAIGAKVRITGGPSAGCRDFTPASRRASASSSCSTFSAANARSRSPPTWSFRRKSAGAANDAGGARSAARRDRHDAGVAGQRARTSGPMGEQRGGSFVIFPTNYGVS